jgi:hypothetical protein
VLSIDAGVHPDMRDAVLARGSRPRVSHRRRRAVRAALSAKARAGLLG